MRPISGVQKAALESDANALWRKEDAAYRKQTAVGWLMRLPLAAASRVARHYYSLATAPLLAIPVVGWVPYVVLNGRAKGGRGFRS